MSSRPRNDRPPHAAVRRLAGGLVLTMAVSCSAAPSPGRSGRPTADTGNAPNGAAVGVGSPIPQPVLPTGVPVAPDRARVDLTVPRFSQPTAVTNPLFPVSRQASVLFVGHVDGRPFRTEVTLLPETRWVQWGGQTVETLVSQYTAFLGGRLQEVADDLYAQADDGSVWYFGEDVADLEHGAVVTKEGTWLAGKDGPAEMIMPADPKIGDVYRTENIPGIAFEQVTVRSTDRTLRGPLGPVEGGMVGQELHMDGSTEFKLFAPGYGEYYTGSGGDVEALAMAVPTDAEAGPAPVELATLLDGAMTILHAPRAQPSRSATHALRRVRTAWQRLDKTRLPRRVVPQLRHAVSDLSRAVARNDRLRARQAAIQTAQWTLDLGLLFHPTTHIDLARFGLWASQLLLDADAGDVDAVRGDVFTLFYMRDRIMDGLSPAQRVEVNRLVGSLQESVIDHDLPRARAAAKAIEALTRRYSPM